MDDLERPVNVVSSPEPAWASDVAKTSKVDTGES